MIIEKYANFIKQLPDHLYREYFHEPFDYTPYECIHTDEYDYYPDLQCVIIDEVPVVWDSSTPYADPANPKHFAEMKRRVESQKQDLMNAVLVRCLDKKLECHRYNTDERTVKYVKERGGLTASIPFEEGDIYYNPDEIDLPNDPDMALLAKCLIIASKYDMIGILPEPDEDPEEWQCVDFVTPEEFARIKGRR